MTVQTTSVQEIEDFPKVWLPGSLSRVWRNFVKGKQMVIVSNMYEVAKQTVFVDASKGKYVIFSPFQFNKPF